MVEIMNFKKGATIIKLNASVTNLNFWGILMPHCGRDKKPENIPLNWLMPETKFHTHTKLQAKLVLCFSFYVFRQQMKR
jgi:hypothetical protein